MTLYGILNPGRAMACEVMGRAGGRECITRVMTTTTTAASRQGNERAIAGENLGDRHGRGAAQVAYPRDVQALSGEKI